MPDVPRELIEHALKVDPKATPKKQRKTKEKQSKKNS
jgi:hypothetical protein